MFVHSSAQRLQASAHFLQCSISCFSHSSAQALHTLAQMPQRSDAKLLSVVINVIAALHMAIHSKSVRMQFAIMVTSSSLRQEATQCSQAAMQSMQASMQVL